MGARTDLVVEQPGGCVQRTARALTVAVVAVGLGSIEHLEDSGGRRLLPVAVSLTLLFAGSWRPARREASGITLLAWLGFGQLVTHEVFALERTRPPTSLRHAALDVTFHVLGAVLAALALRLGEAGSGTARRLRVAMGRLGKRLALFAALPADAPSDVLVVVEPDAAVPWRDATWGWMGRRGPPARLIAG